MLDELGQLEEKQTKRFVKVSLDNLGITVDINSRMHMPASVATWIP